LRSRTAGSRRREPEEYLIDLNATQAAIRAGYSAKNADKVGPRLVGKSGVAAAVQAAKAKRSEATGITAEEVIRELRALALSDIGDVIDFEAGTLELRDPKSIPPAARRALASIKVRRAVEKHGDDAGPVELIEFKLYDKIAALRELAMHLPGFRAPARQESRDPRAELAQLFGVESDSLLRPPTVSP